MEQLHSLVKIVGGFVWGPVMVVLLVGTGVYLTIRLRAIQLTHFSHAWATISGKYDKEDDEGDVTHFEALSTALSATVGTGNIAGVATAISLGGPGALFWLWITAFFGMATKFASCTLGQVFRVIHEDGSASGGPMYYIEKGLGPRWKPLAVFFAACTSIAAFGAGNMVQSHEVANALHQGLGLNHTLTGIVLTVAVAIVILGGIKRIASVASKAVPAMAVFYCLGAIAVLLLHIKAIPAAFALIFKHAFTPVSAAGGFAGATVSQTIIWGVKRGLFSNEAGLGSAPMAHAAAKTKEPVREGMVALLGPFIDTIVICTMTGLVLIVTDAWKLEGVKGAAMTSQAFEIGLSSLTQHGSLVVTLGIGLFAYTTILGWCYYGGRAMKYLFGERIVRPYEILYVAICLGGSLSPKSPFVWDFADAANGLMAIPNLMALIALSGLTAKLARDYIDRDCGTRPAE